MARFYRCWEWLPRLVSPLLYSSGVPYQLIAKWARVIEADFLRFEPVDIGNNSVAGDDFGRVVDWDQSIEGFRPRLDIAVASGTSAIARLLPEWPPPVRDHSSQCKF
jgi:hypothetical protein